MNQEIKEQMNKVKEIKRMREKSFQDRLECFNQNDFKKAEKHIEEYEKLTNDLIHDQEKLIRMMYISL